MKKYSIIYADPPWRYERNGVQGAAEKHYPTMSIDELCRLPVSELSEKDSILFLWTTFPQLREALRVIKAWGFEYKSVAFVWLKLNKSGKGWFYGLGFWTRGNAEICLLQKAIQKENQTVFTNSLSALCGGTVRSPTRQGIKLLSLWAICPA